MRPIAAVLLASGLAAFAVVETGTGVGARMPVSAPAAAAGLASPANSASDTEDAPVYDAANLDTSTAYSSAPAASRVSFKEITIPTGTRLTLVLENSVGSDISRLESPVRAHLARAVVIDGTTAIPSGSAVSGVVTSAVRSGKVKGRAYVAMRFSTLTRRGETETRRIQTGVIARRAPATKQKDAMKIGIPAAGGAIIGGILGGKKGAGIGALAGGGGGTAYVLSTPGKEVRFARGTTVIARLTQPLRVRVKA